MSRMNIVNEIWYDGMSVELLFFLTRRQNYITDPET
jgi:hypothetical protein